MLAGLADRAQACSVVRFEGFALGSLTSEWEERETWPALGLYGAENLRVVQAKKS